LVPNPFTRVVKVWNKKGVETNVKRFGAETNPAVWKNCTVELRDAVEIYPDVPSPVTVDANCVCRKDVETKFNKLGAETNPAAWKNRVVEAKEALEI
jgi:hypothetical protein